MIYSYSTITHSPCICTYPRIKDFSMQTTCHIKYHKIFTFEFYDTNYAYQKEKAKVTMAWLLLFVENYTWTIYSTGLWYSDKCKWNVPIWHFKMPSVHTVCPLMYWGAPHAFFQLYTLKGPTPKAWKNHRFLQRCRSQIKSISNSAMFLQGRRYVEKKVIDRRCVKVQNAAYVKISLGI